MTLSTIPRHQVHLLVVHDDSAGVHNRDRQGVDLEPVIGHGVKGLAASRTLRLSRLSSNSENEPIVDEGKRDFKPWRLQ